MTYNEAKRCNVCALAASLGIPEYTLRYALKEPKRWYKMCERYYISEQVMALNMHDFMERKNGRPRNRIRLGTQVITRKAGKKFFVVGIHDKLYYLSTEMNGPICRTVSHETLIRGYYYEHR